VARTAPAEPTDSHRICGGSESYLACKRVHTVRADRVNNLGLRRRIHSTRVRRSVTCVQQELCPVNGEFPRRYRSFREGALQTALTPDAFAMHLSGSTERRYCIDRRPILSRPSANSDGFKRFSTRQVTHRVGESSHQHV